MNDDAMFMNPCTGHVAPWGEWVQDQKDLGFYKRDLDNLIEVVMDKEGDWVEVE